MLLIGCPLEKARQIADDVCRAVGDHRFVWRDRIFNIGVSVGLVEISRESGTLEELLAAADSACYVAKKQGSGRVAVYSARDEALARHTGEIQWLQKLQSALKESRFQLVSSAHRARLRHRRRRSRDGSARAPAGGGRSSTAAGRNSCGRRSVIG